jgi:Fe/S biogenesis protein NfuA
MITVTDTARQNILELMATQGKPGLALRFGVRGRGQGGFLYRLAFAQRDEQAPGDVAVESGGVTVLIDAESVPLVQGTTIDYVEQGGETGFKIDNPNPLWTDAIAAAVQGVIDQEINPAVGTHGGFVTLLDVREGTAFIQLGGGCQGCGMADVTLKQGIEVRIREVVPSIREVVDTTDHAEGRNPYFSPAKGGQSPYGS